MAATIQKLRDTMLGVEPKVRRLDYGTESLTIKYIPGFEEKYQELEKNGDFFASLVFAYENLVRSRIQNLINLKLTICCNINTYFSHHQEMRFIQIYSLVESIQLQ